MCIVLTMTKIEDVTTISISRRTHARLQELGGKGATFDDILSDVLNQTARHRQAGMSGK